LTHHALRNVVQTEEAAHCANASVSAKKFRRMCFIKILPMLGKRRWHH